MSEPNLSQPNLPPKGSKLANQRLTSAERKRIQLPPMPEQSNLALLQSRLIMNMNQGNTPGSKSPKRQHPKTRNSYDNLDSLVNDHVAANLKQKHHEGRKSQGYNQSPKVDPLSKSNFFGF